MAVVLGLALGALLLQAGSAGAVWRGPAPARPATGAGTQLVMSGTGNGQAVTGFIADTSNPFDPVTDGYPTCATSCSGFTRKDEGFAGIILWPAGRPTAAPSSSSTASTS